MSTCVAAGLAFPDLGHADLFGRCDDNFVDSFGHMIVSFFEHTIRLACARKGSQFGV